MDYYDLPADQAFLISLKSLIRHTDKLLVLRIAGTADQWELPGGLLEMGEKPIDGLLREVREETGLNVAVEQIIAVWDNPVDGFVVRDGRTLNVCVILIGYLCSTAETAVTLSDEHDNFRWVSNSEISELHLAANTDEAIQAYLRLSL